MGSQFQELNLGHDTPSFFVFCFFLIQIFIEVFIFYAVKSMKLSVWTLDCIICKLAALNLTLFKKLDHIFFSAFILAFILVHLYPPIIHLV